MTLRHLNQLSLLIPVLLTWGACSSVKKVKEGEHLLVKNEIIDKDAKLLGLTSDVDMEEIEAYIRQKPNRKVLKVRLHLSLYNSVNEDNLKRKKTRREKRFARKDEKKIKKYQRINFKRERKGKSQKQPKLKNKNRGTFREWVMDIGESPVIYDSLLAEKSAKQIKLYLTNKGFFNAEVRDSVVYKRKKAHVYYLIDHKKPYTIKSLTYSIQDPQVAYYIFLDSANTLIKPGANYDVDKITAERDRITKNLKNTGYFYFAKEYIFFENDSSLGERKVAVKLVLKKREIVDDNFPDSIRTYDHQRYTINDIFIFPDFNPKIKPGTVQQDTVLNNGMFVICTGKPRYHPWVLTEAMMFKKGDLSQSSNTDYTYNRFSELKAFKFINITYKDIGNNQLDCYVYLTPVVKQSFSIETEGTNTGGNLGISGSFVYQNRNVFKGAEVFEFKMKGGLEIQQSDPGANSDATIVGDFIPFNTAEFGPEFNLKVPRFLSPIQFKFSRFANPHTTFSAIVNVQKRPSFSRTAVVGSFNYSWKESAFKRHTFYPIELNLISIDPYADFKEYLESSNDPFIVYRYTDHFIIGSRYNFVYTNQTANKRKSFMYFRGGAESAGTLLRSVLNLVDQYIQDLPTIEGGYLINKTRFSHYLRGDVDLRLYKVFSENNSLVFRVFAGVGKPLHNLRELPFEKSFYSGGPNSVRAWKARTIGPGSFYAEGLSTFDQVGDNQLELNLEYRFNIIKILNAALFTDAGNIWMRKDFTEREGEDFTLSRFYKELAIGSGIGMRLDFSFFIIRLDMGIKIYDPIFSEGNRWVVAHLFDSDWKNNWTPSSGIPSVERYPFYNFNFGIGYPF